MVLAIVFSLEGFTHITDTFKTAMKFCLTLYFFNFSSQFRMNTIAAFDEEEPTVSE